MKKNPASKPSHRPGAGGLPLAVLAVGVVAVLACAAEPETRETTVYSAAAFHNTTSYSGASFSADESRLLISSDVTGVSAVYSVQVAGGEPKQLTDSAGPVFAQSYFPDDDRFLYAGDQGGNELNHLYVGSDGAGDVPEGGVDLTPGANVRASFAGWRADGEAFFVRTNERTPFAMDLYRYSVPPPGTWDFERELVFENDGAFNLGDVSDDGRWLALDKLASNYDSDVYAYDLMAGHLVHVTEHEGEVEHSSGGFTPDSAQLCYGTNEHGEFNQMWSYDLAGGARELVLAADWDVFGVSFSETGRYRVSAINEDASTSVEVLDTETGAPVALPDLPAGDIGAVRFSASDRLMAFYLSSDRSPSDLYVYDLEQGGEALRLTQSLNPEIDPEDLVTPEVIRYPSFDGLEIPAILWRPHGASAENPAPAMVWVHGGPGGQTRRSYRADIQHLVNQGYVVLGREQPRFVRLRQDLLPHGRQEARRGRPAGLRLGPHLARVPGLGGWFPGWHHRRQLRRLHGGRGAGVRVRGVRCRHRHLRGHELDPDAGEHAALVAGAEGGAARRAG